MKLLNNFIPIILFALLSLLIVFPLLSPGYILTLDAVMASKIPVPSLTSSGFLLNGLLFLLNLIIPSYWLQKIFIFLTFFLSGWGMFRLVRVDNLYVKIFAGLFYTVNPFVYERIMAGQWHLLLGYGIFPYFIMQIMDFFDNPSKKSAIRLAILTTVIVNIVVNFSLILVCFFIIYGFIYTLLFPRSVYSLSKYSLIFAGLVFLFNINWLLPTLFNKSDLSETISVFTNEDLIAFQSVEDKHFGLIFNLVSGYGFWPEAHKYFILPKEIIFFWPVLSLTFIVLFFGGIVKLFQEKNKEQYPLLITLLIMFLLSLDFAGGIALKSFANSVFWLYNSFPILRGFREPHKLIGIVMFCYAFFGSIGLLSIIERLKNKLKYIFLAIFLVLPFIYTPTIFGGFWGQLRSVFYPESWTKVNNVLGEDKDDFLTLFFPWHQYMRFHFNSGRVVSNPAPYFFDKPILSSRNYETMPLYTHDIRPGALHVEGLLTIEKEGVNLLGEQVEEKLPWGQSLSPIGVKYIILAKDDDWQTYKFLENQPDLKKVYESSDIDLYQNMEWRREEVMEN